MHCPECHVLNEPDAAACSDCGLLLINALPKRRAEDFAEKRRRSSDHDNFECRFCGGAIPLTAIRCKHCSEIVNDSYYRERARRVRSRVNFASWIAYLFGLAALLVFRPVGVISIAGGLLLSIAYYAIPVDPPSPSKKLGIGARLLRQLKMERVSISIPRFPTKKLVFVGTPLIATLIGYSANLFLLQEPMNDVLKQNAAFRGMKVSAHYKYWVVPGIVEYDLQSLSFRQTPIDVHTAMLEFAKRVRAKRFSRVELSYRGVTKFSIDGATFQRLGDEYAKRNFDFVLYSCPRLFHAVGKGKDPGGATDRDALLDFHRQWYGNDPMTRTIANGL